MTEMRGTRAPEGWYSDPDDPTLMRWWDGSQWTSHRAQPGSPRVTGSARVRGATPLEMLNVVGLLIAWLVLVPLTLGLGAAVALTWLGAKVGFRWRDGLFLIVPIYNYVYLSQVLMRIACWQRHYWADRPEPQST